MNGQSRAASLRPIRAGTLAKIETTVQAHTRVTIQGQKAVSATHRYVMPKPKELARRLKKVAGKKRLPGQKVTLKQQGSPKRSKQAGANSGCE